MKKYISLFVLFAFLATATTVVHASAYTTLMSRINDLLSEVQNAKTSLPAMASMALDQKAISVKEAALSLDGGTQTISGSTTTVGVSVPPVIPPSLLGRPVNKASSSASVMQLQTVLHERGYFSGQITGRYDEQTTASVRAFQAAHGIASVGVVGPQTLKVLNGPVETSYSFRTYPATNVTTTSATLNAKIAGVIDPHSTNYPLDLRTYFKYGTSPQSLTMTTLPAAIVGGSVSVNLLDLIPNTTYYFRAVYDFGPTVNPRLVESYGISTFETTIAAMSCGPTATPSITVLSPNAGQSYQAGTQMKISWTPCRLQRDGGISISIGNVNGVGGRIITDLPITQTSYVWSIPSTIVAGQYKVNVFCAEKYSDAYCQNNTGPISSTGFFTVNSSNAVSNPVLTVTVSPNTPTSQNIMAGSNNVKLAEFVLTSSGPLGLGFLQFRDENGNLSLLKNIHITQDGQSIGSTVTAAPNGYVDFQNLNSSFIGLQSKKIAIYADISATASAGKKIQMYISGNSFTPFIGSSPSTVYPAFPITTGTFTVIR